MERSQSFVKHHLLRDRTEFLNGAILGTANVRHEFHRPTHISRPTQTLCVPTAPIRVIAPLVPAEFAFVNEPVTGLSSR